MATTRNGALSAPEQPQLFTGSGVGSPASTLPGALPASTPGSTPASGTTLVSTKYAPQAGSDDAARSARASTNAPAPKPIIGALNLYFPDVGSYVSATAPEFASVCRRTHESSSSERAARPASFIATAP